MIAELVNAIFNEYLRIFIGLVLGGLVFYFLVFGSSNILKKLFKPRDKDQ
tara:strand:- start:461 stop:610 length:150 start_codon:yes stop_codon:yes gene_type:complete